MGQERSQGAEINLIGQMTDQWNIIGSDLGDAPINLPGPAAPVSFVPAHDALLAMFKEAGFTRAEITFHASTCCFQVGDVGLRDTRIEAVK